MSKPVIFYGAGNDAMRFSNLMQKYNPVCFVDIDEKKHYKMFYGLEILPLVEAVERYPNYILYLTQAYESLQSVTDYLLARLIPRERIKYADAYEWRFYCWNLEHRIDLYGNKIAVCVGNPITGDREYFRRSMNNFESGLKNYYQLRNELYDLHRHGIEGPCKFCDLLSEGIFPIHLDLQTKIINFNTAFDGDICNIKCIFCFQNPRLIKNFGGNVKDILMQIVEYYAKSKLPLPTLRFFNGELFARKDADEILNYLLDIDCKIFVATNATIFSETFVKLIHAGKVTFINVSLDAGTRETYKKIKGFDFFHMVMNNLKKYSNEGLSIILKYIFLPGINDNKLDIEGFIKIAEHLKADIELSSDCHFESINKPLPDHTMNVVLDTYNKAVKCGLNVKFHKEQFSIKDRSVIESVLK